MCTFLSFDKSVFCMQFRSSAKNAREVNKIAGSITLLTYFCNLNPQKRISTRNNTITVFDTWVAIGNSRANRWKEGPLCCLVGTLQCQHATFKESSVANKNAQLEDMFWLTNYGTQFALWSNITIALPEMWQTFVFLASSSHSSPVCSNIGTVFEGVTCTFYFPTE